ncbi:MAG: tetratricopeptide repeat protein, partial [Candidatus Thorarchaeota archaeon]
MTKNSLKKAVELIAKGNAAEAVSLLEQELASGNIDTEVMVCLGIAYVQSEQPEMAIDVLTQVLDRTRDQSVVKLFLGRAYKATGKYDLAMEHLSDVLMLDPQLPEAWSDISEIHYLMGRCDLALSTLDDSIRRFPKDPMLHRLKALILQRLGDYTESVREFELAFRLRPDTL